MPKSKVRKKKTKAKNNNSIETKDKFFIIEEDVKMSEVLLDFANPLLEHCEDIEEHHKVIAYATLIWNLTNLPKADGERFKKDICKMLEHDEILLQDGMEMMEMMLARKDKYFKNMKRMIVDYDISVTDGQMNVQIVSTLN